MSVQAAKEVIPQPVIVHAVCNIDIPSRTIAVRLSELVEGHRFLCGGCVPTSAFCVALVLEVGGLVVVQRLGR